MKHKMGWIFQKVLYPQLVWNKYSDQKTIYLTFDDGPIPELTEFVVKTLASFKAKATFFCVGENIGKHPYIFEQLMGNGHSVGNHTNNHLDGWKNEDWHYVENVRICQSRIEEKVGFIGKKLLRPPYGKIKYSQINLLKNEYDIVMWDVLSMDYNQKLAKEECLHKTINNTENGSIVVFHDNLKAKKNLEYVLPRYLEYFAKREYEFAAL